jgi:hypothetical protein
MGNTFVLGNDDHIMEIKTEFDFKEASGENAPDGRFACICCYFTLALQIAS